MLLKLIQFSNWFVVITEGYVVFILSPVVGIRYLVTKVKSAKEEEALLGLNVSFQIFCKREEFLLLCPKSLLTAVEIGEEQE